MIKYSIGNKKIGDDTVILNLYPALNCPALDKCLLSSVCYARANERLRSNCRKYREKQAEIWQQKTAEEFASELMDIKTRKLKYIRLQESGDFGNQEDVDKCSKIAELLDGEYRVYTYTNRYDLDYSAKHPNLVVTGTYNMIDNSFIPLRGYVYRLLKWMKIPNTVICPGDCRGCTLCKEARYKDIYIYIH
jgi:hypothetical protein